MNNPTLTLDASKRTATAVIYAPVSASGQPMLGVTVNVTLTNGSGSGVFAANNGTTYTWVTNGASISLPANGVTSGSVGITDSVASGQLPGTTVNEYVPPDDTVQSMYFVNATWTTLNGSGFDVQFQMQFQPTVTSNLASPTYSTIGASLTDTVHVGLASGDIWGVDDSGDYVPVKFVATLYGPITTGITTVSGGAGRLTQVQNAVRSYPVITTTTFTADGTGNYTVGQGITATQSGRYFWVIYEAIDDQPSYVQEQLKDDYISGAWDTSETTTVPMGLTLSSQISTTIINKGEKPLDAITITLDQNSTWMTAENGNPMQLVLHGTYYGNSSTPWTQSAGHPPRCYRCAKCQRHRHTTHLGDRTIQLKAGVDITVIALWLGHGQVTMTNIYLRADMSLKEAAMAKTDPLGTGTPSSPYHAKDTLLTNL